MIGSEEEKAKEENALRQKENEAAGLLAHNAPIVNRICDLLANAGPNWNGVLLMITNTVETLCAWMQQRTGLDRRRILGYTLNDSLRLRTGSRREEKGGGVHAF